MTGNAGREHGSGMKGQPFSLHFAPSTVMWQIIFLKLSQEVPPLPGLFFENIASCIYRRKHFVPESSCCIMRTVICVIDVVI